MNYLLKGNLLGYLCSDCHEPIAHVLVRLYRLKDQSQAPILATSATKETFHQLNERELKEKAGRLIAEAETNEAGDFTFELDEQHKYDGGAFEIDVEIRQISPEQPNRRQPPPQQFHLTTLQPQWRSGSENQAVFAWHYRIPDRWWCRIRQLFGWWTICGHVVDCETKKPLGGLTVFAFDVDWLQDDPLGSDVTDSNGHFRINYTQAQFEQTLLSPWLNAEWPAGPDIYFRIESSGGDILLQESRNRGHDPDRENRGPCFCVELCVKAPTPTPTDTPSAWTGIGSAFTIPAGGMLNDFDNDGYAGAAKYALTSTIRMTGSAPHRSSAGNPIEYRFLVSDTTASNSAAPLGVGNFTKIVGVTTGLFASTRVGQMVRFSPYRIVQVYAEQADLDAEGWLDVNQSILRTFSTDPTLNPAELSTPGLWQWVDLDGLIAINTTALTTQPNVPISAANAGQAVPAANRISIEKVALRFEVREVINKPAAIFNYLPGSGQTLNALIINNNAAFYKVVIKEQADGSSFCGELSGNIHVAYTAYHPHLQSVSINLRSNDNLLNPAVGINANLQDATQGVPISGNTNALVTHVNNPSLLINTNPGLLPQVLKKCTYSLKLHVQRRLHNGESGTSDAPAETVFYYVV